MLMSIAISDNAESTLWKQETAMGETISVSVHRGDAVAERQWYRLMIFLPPRPAQCLKAAGQSQWSWCPWSTLLPCFIYFSKPTEGQRRGKRGVLSPQVVSVKPPLGCSTWAPRKSLISKESLCRGQQQLLACLHWRLWKVINTAANFKKQIFTVELLHYNMAHWYWDTTILRANNYYIYVHTYIYLYIYLYLFIYVLFIYIYIYSVYIRTW